MSKHDFLTLAIAKAQESVAKGGFPAGSILVKDSSIVGEGISIGNPLYDPTSHAEIAAIRTGCAKLQTTDLVGAVLYSSLEPCMMCLAAAHWSGIRSIIFACAKERVSSKYYGGDYKTADINSLFSNPIELSHNQTREVDSLACVREWEKKLHFPPPF